MDPQTSSEPVGETWKYNPDYHRVVDFLGVDKHDRENYDVASKVSYLVDWAADKGGAKDFDSALSAINKVRKETGTQVQGKTLVNQLYHYVRLLKSPVKPQLAKTLPKAPPKATQKPQNDFKDTITQSVTKMTAPLQKTVNEAVKTSVNNMIQQSLKEMIR